MQDLHDEAEQLDISDGDAAQVEDQDTGAEAEDRGDDVAPDAKPEAASQGGIEGSGEADQGEGDGGDDAGARDGQMIPKARFDEVNNERRWLREQLAAARGGEQPKAEAPAQPEQPQPYDFDAAEDSYLDAMYEGDKDKAKSIRREINEKNRELVRQEATRDAREHVTQHEAETALNQAAAAVVADYPFLNSEAEGANKQAIDDVVGWRDIYMARGKTPGEALRMAADKVGPMYAPALEAEVDTPADAGEKRAADARRRNAEAANKQPAAPAGVGARGDGNGGDVNIEDMTDEEFDNLSAAAKSRLRGD